MSATCPRLFEVEALRDGRLTGVERSRFESHLSVCGACAREAHALRTLADELRSAGDGADSDELHVRRERTRLLAAFDEGLVPSARPPRFRLWLGAAAAVLVLGAVVAAFVGWPVRPAPRAALSPAPEPITVRADSSARWSRRSEAGIERVVLDSGALSIRVDHATSQRRLLVVLPDGELEDIGTTFSVSAAAGHTTRVTVQDGSVVLRLRGTPPIALGAGDAWSPPPLPAVAASAVATPSPAASSATLMMPAAPSAKHAVAAATDSDPSADFRAAMASLDSGDNATAASRFAAFLARHPQNARAEDAAYLRILAFERAGNSAATQRAARDYLARYPHGFRHAEAEALAR
ncbi:MAG: FecR domain-containing protein [Myxococcales bacterium]